jgi:hypothetical protein
MDRTCPAWSARRGPHTTSYPRCGGQPRRRERRQAAGATGMDQAVRNTAVAGHLSTFAGLVVPFEPSPLRHGTTKT